MFKNVFFALGTVVLLALGWYYLPFHAPYTITVTGTAQGTTANNMATFNATISATNSDKQTAINTVNTKMTALIKALKDFGIAEADIKTQQVSVYQQPEILPMRGSESSQTLIYPVPPQQTGNLVWYASNSIEVTVRDITKASQISDILNKSGATNVYGPNLSADQNSQNDVEILSKAVADARKKAESIAKAGGQTVGRMVNVSESGNAYPVPLYAKGVAESTTTPIQPGTSTSYKSVTVVFELK